MIPDMAARRPGGRDDAREMPARTDEDSIVHGAAYVESVTAAVQGAVCADLLRRLGIDADECGQLFGVTGRAWRKWDAAGLVPAPFYLGRLPRWSPEELRAWSAAGAASRECWEAMRGGRS